MVVCLLVTGLTSVLVWRLVPEDQRDDILDAFNKSKDVLGDIPNSPFGNDDNPNGGYQFMQCTDGQPCCNGLSSICNLRVDEVMFAGSHNAMSSRDKTFYIAPNHLLSLEQSLKSGYRAINMDIGSCGGELRLIHGTCLPYRKPAEVLLNILSFLRLNPSEVIVLNLEIDGTEDEPLTLEALGELVQSVDGFTDMMYNHSNPNAPWPTLGQLVESNKRILLFHYNGPRCETETCPPGFHDWFTYAAETKFSFNSMEEVQNTTGSCEFTRGASSSNFLAVNLFLAIPKRSDQEELNKFEYIQSHVGNCSANNGDLDMNIVYVDFWSKGDLPKFVQVENLKRAERAAQAESAAEGLKLRRTRQLGGRVSRN